MGEGENRFGRVVALLRDLLSELESEFEQTRQDAITDALTGIYNRRFFDLRLRDEVARARRYGNDLCLVFVDLDDFKFYNDRHGHTAGDELLRRIVAAIRQEVRDPDVLTRYGGEEFAMILPHTPVAGALRLLERIRQRLAVEMGQVVTFSAGVAAYPEHGTSVIELVEAADSAVYRAKNTGKDRVCVSGSADGPDGPDDRQVVTEDSLPAARAGAAAAGEAGQAGSPAGGNVLQEFSERVQVGFRVGETVPASIWTRAGLVPVKEAHRVEGADRPTGAQDAFRVDTPQGVLLLVRDGDGWRLQPLPED